MRRFYRILAVFLFITPLSAFAQDIPLTDDQSRGDLFELMLQRLANKAPAPERQQYAFPLAFSFPHDALWKDPILDVTPRGGQVFGVDLSHHNAEECHCMPDFAAMYDHRVRFAYFKATQGEHGVDNYYVRYRTAALAQPINKRVPVGPYHFLSANGTGAAQAAHFLAFIKGNFDGNDLPPTMDLEWDVRLGPDHKVIRDANGEKHDFWTGTPGKHDGVSGEEILRRTLAFLTAVKAATGRVPLIYTNRVWWHERIGDDKSIARLAGYPIWIADYSKSGRANEVPSSFKNIPWTLWQFSDSGRFTSGGMPPSRTIDANVFTGSEDSLHRAMGLPK